MHDLFESSIVRQCCNQWVSSPRTEVYSRSRHWTKLHVPLLLEALAKRWAFRRTLCAFRRRLKASRSRNCTSAALVLPFPDCASNSNQPSVISKCMAFLPDFSQPFLDRTLSKDCRVSMITFSVSPHPCTDGVLRRPSDHPFSRFYVHPLFCSTLTEKRCSTRFLIHSICRPERIALTTEPTLSLQTMHQGTFSVGGPTRCYEQNLHNFGSLP